MNAATAQEQPLPTNIPGRGMAKCFLSQAFQAQGSHPRALQQLNFCQQKARPETLDEYQWLINAGLQEVARKADITAIVH